MRDNLKKTVKYRLQLVQLNKGGKVKSAQSECVCFDSRIVIKVNMFGDREWRRS